MKMLGLIGGMSWVSTVDYYRLINEGINQRLGGSQYARCIIHSLNFADVQGFTATLDWDGFLEVTAAAATHLRESGAECIVLCANTAHIVADRLEKRVGLPVINIVDATAAAINAKGLKHVALLGTRFTMELDFFRDRLAQHGITAVTPSEDDRAFIHRSIFDELGKGVLLDETRQRYRHIITALADHGAEGAILGCTEIPLLIKQKDCPVPAFDTTEIHASAIVDFALG